MASGIWAAWATAPAVRSVKSCVGEYASFGRSSVSPVAACAAAKLPSNASQYVPVERQIDVVRRGELADQDRPLKLGAFDKRVDVDDRRRRRTGLRRRRCENTKLLAGVETAERRRRFASRRRRPSTLLTVKPLALMIDKPPSPNAPSPPAAVSKNTSPVGEAVARLSPLITSRLSVVPAAPPSNETWITSGWLSSPVASSK